MARVKVRPETAARTDYEPDFFAWTQEQALTLRARGTLALDWDNLAEEIASIGRRHRRELEARLRRMIHHLLKWQVQPERRGRSWRDTLIEQRRQAEKLLRESPSRRSQLLELRDEAYPDAVRDAVSDSGLRPHTFPSECASSIGQILEPDYLPDDES